MIQVEGIFTGGGRASTSSKPNDVTFIDYDGAILYSYSLEEAQALTELPELPSHDGLVCQGWNWTLEAIKALNLPVTVGAMYITDDGATRLHIRIETAGRMTVPLRINQTVANGVSIDWGDGSTSETLSGTGNVNTTHTYAEPGDYVISLMPNDGCTLSLGFNSSSFCVMGSTNDDNIVYRNFLKAVRIGNGVTRIAYYAFSNCHSLSSITIPDGVTIIGDYAFKSCFSLSSITIPDGVNSIGHNAFDNCHSLSSITIPDGVTSIGDYAFGSCFSLSSITIGVKSIGYHAFDSCYSLSSITIPDGVTIISNYAFGSCFSLSSINIPNGVKSISNYAFDNCHSLSSITIPDGVTSIGDYAFQNCRLLSSITISDSVTKIGNRAFRLCSSLVSITIPSSLTSIDDYAFSSCYGIRYYDFSACTAIPALSTTNVFSGIQSDCQMLIPSALYDEWSTATNWATYASYMVAV